MASAFFGGSFDPPHLGHLAVARGALASGKCDLVRFVVGARPPHKIGVRQSSFADRMAMTAALIAGCAGMEVSDLETRLPADRPTYTIDALALYRIVYDEAPVLLVGADSLLQLHTWRAAEKLVDEYEIATYPRPGCEVTREALQSHWSAARAEKLLAGVLPGELFAVSSSELKKLLGTKACNLETTAVREYVLSHRLYEEEK